jgi:mono/diheme cytochrome c family protein
VTETAAVEDLPASGGLLMHKIFCLCVAACAITAFFTVASAQAPAAVEAGEALYDEHCAMCHGENLRSAGAIPDLRELHPERTRP